MQAKKARNVISRSVDRMENTAQKQPKTGNNGRSDEIKKRAYFKFVNSGMIHGNDWANWFEAEKEVKNEKQPVR